MGKGGISPSGKVLRYAVWRLPRDVAVFSWNRNLTAASEEGKRALALAGFGLWVAGFWYAATLAHRWFGVVVPLQVAGLLGLLLIWRIVGLGRRWWVQRGTLKAQAVSLKRQREMYEMQKQALGYVKRLPGQIPGGGTVTTMFGSMRHHDPAEDEGRQMAADQAREARSTLPPDDRDVPLGDRFEPILRLPHWRRRKADDQPKDNE